MKIITLKKTSQFKLLLKKGKKVVTKGVVIIALPQEDLGIEQENEYLHLGYITSKKIGNAVIRNRVRRRLREVVKEVFSILPDQQLCYVFIGRKSGFDRPFSALKKDCVYAYHQLKQQFGK